MTFAIGHVDGGTHAGHKKPMRDKPLPWRCECVSELAGTSASAQTLKQWQPGYLKTCPACKTTRP